jgi:radical SAM protein with 4Fe4S-binding SPASM domain
MNNAQNSEESGLIRFAHVELTNQCNLRCTHCYSDAQLSRPSGELGTEEILSVLCQLSELGCKKVQLVGGEPLLHPFINRIVEKSLELFAEVELYSNIQQIERLNSVYLENDKLLFATTHYGVDEVQFDKMAQKPGAFKKWLSALTILQAKPERTRIAIVANEKSTGEEIEHLESWVKSMGFTRISVDRVRPYGRAALEGGIGDSVEGLCGQCDNGQLAIAPNGDVFPCVMSRFAKLGNIRMDTLGEIFRSRQGHEFYAALRSSFPKSDVVRSCNPDSAGCNPNACNPQGLPSCTPTCNVGRVH